MLYRKPEKTNSPSIGSSQANGSGRVIGSGRAIDKRAVPKERDGAKNPWKAMVRLGEDYNNNMEQQRQAKKAENKFLLK
jgi:hypothetical protein